MSKRPRVKFLATWLAISTILSAPPANISTKMASNPDMAAIENQDSVTLWANATFGAAGSNVRVAARANEEMAELIRALSVDDNSSEALEEIADIFIILYRLAWRLGGDVHAEIDRKMAINRAREWKLDGSGHGYHTTS